MIKTTDVSREGLDYKTQLSGFLLYSSRIPYPQFEIQKPLNIRIEKISFEKEPEPIWPDLVANLKQQWGYLKSLFISVGASIY